MTAGEYRYFVTYSGVKLPLRLVNQLDAAELENRNTYIRAQFDGQERLIAVEKFVYGEVELAHRYDYHPNGALKAAHITMDDDTTVLEFGEEGTG
ncbi:MAG: hypothetical protein HY765_00655 [Rhodomicrobium sp.]|nr:hypothetical protein [Rhodomicrobium sp.]